MFWSDKAVRVMLGKCNLAVRRTFLIALKIVL